MKKIIVIFAASFLPLAAFAVDGTATNLSTPPRVPAFSTNYMDLSVSPATNFYEFADGNWVKNNPVPPDKSRWASFSELAERNWFLIHSILDEAAAGSGSLPGRSPQREVGDFLRQ